MPRHSFPKSRHLRRPGDFATVYNAKVRDSRGPLMVYALPNELGHPRLGLSVSRKVGNAVRRNRVRRLLKEAFRLLQHDLPTGYDWVTVVRPHEPLTLAEYQKLMSGLVVRLHRKWWERRAAERSPAESESPAAREPTAGAGDAAAGSAPSAEG